ncbi:MAG: HlyD family secretion protein [Bacteroidales bacterium]|nr:HlyD family secretion protein [Bacteroidales bacterium]
MTWKAGFRAIALAFGVSLAAAVLVGADRLLERGAGTTTATGGAVQQVSGTAPHPGGVIVLGTVGPDPIGIGQPAVAAMVTVSKVLAKDGDVVQPGTPLVQFEDRMVRAKLAQARAELAAAEQDLIKADVQIQVHALQLELQQLAITAAKDDLTAAEAGYKATRDALDRVLDAERNLNTNQPLSDAEKQRRRDENAELQKTKALVTQLQHKVESEKMKLNLHRLDPVNATRTQAAAKVERLKATITEAEAAIDTCLIRSPIAGTIEQMLATPGMTYGPSSRNPLAWLVPSGNLIVRAEVEAEFANRVAGSMGKKVIIYDHNNFQLTYEGTVTRVGTAFLPKRTVGEVLAVTPGTRVLECVIDVADPAPTGRPPLRVGQPVRVSFP